MSIFFFTCMKWSYLCCCAGLQQLDQWPVWILLGYDGSLPQPSACKDHLQRWENWRSRVSEPRGEFQGRTMVDQCNMRVMVMLVIHPDLIIYKLFTTPIHAAFWLDHWSYFPVLECSWSTDEVMITMWLCAAGVHTKPSLEGSWRHVEAVRHLPQSAPASLQHHWSGNLLWHLGVH